MNTTDDDTKQRETAAQQSADKRWQDSFRIAFDKHNPPSELPGEVLREVRRATRETGESAQELFGPAEEYAALVAEERISAERRSAVDRTGRTPATRLRNGISIVLGWFVGTTLHNWLVGGNSEYEITTRSLLTTVVIVGSAMVVIGLVPALRAAGRLRASWWALGGTIVGGATATTTTLVADPPAPILAVLHPLVVSGVLAAVAGLIHLIPKDVVAGWFETREDQGDDEAWFHRLDSLLRGRHGVAIRVAKNHVAEAREHHATAGSSARNVFGPVEHYARALADTTPAADRKARRTAALHAFLGVCAAVFATMAAVGSGSGYDLVAVCIFLPCALILLGHSIVLLRRIPDSGR